MGERFELDRERHVKKRRVEIGADGERRESIETIDASFRGVGEVAALDREGDARSYFYTIESFTERRGADQLALPAGTTVRVVRALSAADAVIEVDGRPATERQREAFGAFIDITISGVGDDAVFGTPEPKRVNQAWSARTDLVRDKLAWEGVTVGEDRIRAVAKLIGVEPTGEGHRRKVRCQLTIEDFDLAGLPEGAKIGDASLASTVDMVLAPDGFVLEQSSSRTTRLTVAVARDGEAARTLEIHDTSRYESRNRPL
jgi:hypothetical protein